MIVTGWGVMNPATLKNAARVGFPMDHIIGNFWTGSEEDVEPAGTAAKGYISAAINPSGKDFKVMQEIERVVYGAGKGNMADKDRMGSIYYNRGVLTGIVTVEAIRVAQGKFGKKPLTGEQVRWGLENMNLDAARIAALGATNFIQPLKVTCADHEGGGAVEVPAVGRDEVEDHQRLDPAGQGAGASTDRGERDEVRQGEQHHSPRLQQGEQLG